MVFAINTCKCKQCVPSALSPSVLGNEAKLNECEVAKVPFSHSYVEEMSSCVGNSNTGNVSEDKHS